MTRCEMPDCDTVVEGRRICRNCTRRRQLNERHAVASRAALDLAWFHALWNPVTRRTAG